jgi:NUMOD3 motif
MNNFYVYLHNTILPRDKGGLFYVGKGKGRRARSKNRNSHWKAIVAKYGYTVEIFADGLTEEQAFELEMFSIQVYGRSALCNLTDGGDGTSGMKHSEETKAKVGAASKGNTYGKGNTNCLGRIPSAETRAKIGAASKGRTHSKQTKDRMSAARKGKKKAKGKILSEAHKAKLSATLMGNTRAKGLKGKAKSKEHRANISAALTGKAQPNISAAKMGKPWSPARRKAYLDRTNRQKDQP